VGRALGH